MKGKEQHKVVQGKYMTTIITEAVEPETVYLAEETQEEIDQIREQTLEELFGYVTLPATNEADQDILLRRLGALSSKKVYDIDNAPLEAGIYVAYFTKENRPGYALVGSSKNIRNSVRYIRDYKRTSIYTHDVWLVMGDPKIYVWSYEENPTKEELKAIGNVIGAELGMYKSRYIQPHTDPKILSELEKLKETAVWSGYRKEIRQHMLEETHTLYMFEWSDGNFYIGCTEDGTAKWRIRKHFKDAISKCEFNKRDSRSLYSYWHDHQLEEPKIYLLATDVKDVKKEESKLIRNLKPTLNQKYSWYN